MDGRGADVDAQAGSRRVLRVSPEALIGRGGVSRRDVNSI